MVSICISLITSEFLRERRQFCYWRSIKPECDVHHRHSAKRLQRQEEISLFYIAYFQYLIAHFSTSLWLQVGFIIWSQVTAEKFPNVPQGTILDPLKSTLRNEIAKWNMSSPSNPLGKVMALQVVLDVDLPSSCSISIHSWAALHMFLDCLLGFLF